MSIHAQHAPLLRLVRAALLALVLGLTATSHARAELVSYQGTGSIHFANAGTTFTDSDTFTFSFDLDEAAMPRNFDGNGGAFYEQGLRNFSIDSLIAVPEPSTGMLLGLGLWVMACLPRRRHAGKAAPI